MDTLKKTDLSLIYMMIHHNLSKNPDIFFLWFLHNEANSQTKTQKP